MFRKILLILILPSLVFSDSFNQFRKDRFKTGRTTLTVKGNPSIIWKNDIGHYNLYETNTAVTDEEGNIYVVSKKGLASIKSTSEINWDTTLSNVLLRTTPCLTANGLCVVLSRDGALYALDKNTGQVEWTFQIDFTNDNQWYVPLLGKDDKIYIGAADNGLLYCISSNGEIVWTHNNVLCYYLFTDAADSLLLTNNHAGPGPLFVYNFNNGEFIANWGEDFRGYPTGDPVNKIFYCHYYYGLRAMDLDGNIVWNSESFDGSGRNAPLIGNNDRIYAIVSEHIYAIDKNTGKIIWNLELSGISGENFGAVDGQGKIILIQTVNNISSIVFVNDNNSSASYKAVNLGIKTRSSITLGYPGFVYVCGSDGYLYCIGDKTGFSDNKKTNKLPYHSLSISPNPFSSRLSISLPSSASIYSLTGQLIMKLDKGKHTIDTSSWREGVYIVKAGKESKRVVKVN